MTFLHISAIKMLKHNCDIEVSDLSDYVTQYQAPLKKSKGQDLDVNKKTAFDLQHNL